MIVWVVRTSLHLSEVVNLESSPNLSAKLGTFWQAMKDDPLFLHLTHFGAEIAEILIGVTLAGFQGVVLQKELLQLVGGIEVRLLRLRIRRRV